MELIKRINFKQPKYILPALLYLPLLFTGYFVIDIFHTKKAEIQDPNLETTEYYNDKLPEANVSKPIEGKMESMNRSYDQLKDFSAVDNIDRDEADGAKEEYESKYSEEERKALEASSTERELEMERQLRQSADRAAALQQQDGDYPFPLTERERLIQSQQREQALREELEQALAQLREQSAAQVTGNAAGTTPVESSRAVVSPQEEDESYEVVKRVRQSSDYFHTVSENEPQPDLIKAIIDEDIKAVDGSRVRLRLLDDVEIGTILLPKGSYIYAIMSGFSGQRVKGTVKSLLLYDEIVRVSLSMYDTDGLEGLYIPSSSFRETTRDVASGALGSNMSLSQGNYSNSLSQWGMQALQNAYQRTTSALGKAVRKNSAQLKYGTFVYLVNAKETRNE
ncbi:MAG: conjugative transposon protein TraM [Bacteroidales bacterium]|jgi:conjugative transposon TraM protein|nr:conjugative transposon protein TraM [Bacteroidales bacterium]